MNNGAFPHVAAWAAAGLLVSMTTAVAAGAGQAPTRPAAAPATAKAAPARQAARPEPLSPQTRQKLLASLERAAAYVRSQQKADGTWENHPGITALVITALVHQPGTDKGEQVASLSKSLDSLVALAKPDGGIYEKAIPYYITATAATALAAAGRPADQPLVEKARVYLAGSLLDEGEGVDRSDKWYGGMGYGGTAAGDRRADIISLEYGLRAMKDAALPADNAAWEKALKFVQRTQNHTESNDQAWSADDGGFVYYPGFTYHQSGGTTSYGSATYAGLLSYAWSDVKKDDHRVRAVMKWVRDNYTVDENPGMGQKAVYYYYMVFAKALQAFGDPVITDAKGRRHNWREDLAAKLLSLQKPEGYWVNTDPAEMQDNKVLVTSFTMTAIEAILQ